MFDEPILIGEQRDEQRRISRICAANVKKPKPRNGGSWESIPSVHSIHHNHSCWSNQSLMMSVVVGAGKKLSLDEIVRVAVHNQIVSVAGSAAVHQRTQGLLDSNTLNAQKDSAGVERMPRAICRAGIVCFISSLLQSRSPNLQLSERLVNLLNVNVLPAFTTCAAASQELISFFRKEGFCYSNTCNGIVDCASIELSPASLTAEESEALSSYPFLTIGLGCIVAAASASFIRLVDCVSALSCEAAGSSAEPFDGANFEVCRPHRGQMQSAANLRLLLDGSKRVGSCSKDKLAALTSLHNAPQVTGPCRDVIVASVK